MEAFLGPVEDTIHEFFIPAMLQEKARAITDNFFPLLAQGVKQGGMNLRDPAKAAAQLHQNSSEACALLATSLKDTVKLDSLAHDQCVMQGGHC